MNIISPDIFNRIDLIAESITAKAKLDDDGVFWYTREEGSNNFLTIKNESIATGVSGILLFLLERYNATKDQTQLEVIKLGIHWAANFTKKNKSTFSLYTGKAGVVYTLIKIYESTGEIHLLEKAELLVKDTNFQELLNNNGTELNLYEGLAGAVLVLLHLHSKTQSQWLLQIINDLVDHLICQAKLSPSGGIYWRGPKQINVIKDLCGFAEGTAGIEFMFLELGKYLQNPAFFWIVEQCYLYESSVFDTKRENWPDFKKGKITENDLYRLSIKYKWGLGKSYFTLPAYSDSWDGGRTGLALSRAACFQKCGEKFRYEFYHASKRIAEQLMHLSQGGKYNLTLKEGIPGMAMLMLEAYQLQKEGLFLEAANHAANHLWTWYTKKHNASKNSNEINKVSIEDTSLFSGIAGMGYFFLRLTDAGKIQDPSILRPDITTAYQGSSVALPEVLKFSKQDIIKKILKSNFPKTVDVAHKLGLPEHIFEIDENNLKAVFINNLSRRMVPNGALLQDVLEFEHVKGRVADLFTNKLFLAVKKFSDLSATKSLLKKNDWSKLIRAKLVMTKDAYIHSSRWPWAKASNEFTFDADQQDEPHVTLFIPSIGHNVDEYSVDYSSDYFLTKFKTPKKPLEVFNEIYEENNIDDRKEMMEVLTGKLIYFLRIGAIVRARRVVCNVV